MSDEGGVGAVFYDRAVHVGDGPDRGEVVAVQEHRLTPTTLMYADSE